MENFHIQIRRCDFNNGAVSSELKLPANAWEIQDALDQARITDENDITVMVSDTPYYLTGIIPDNPDLYELNFLVQRMAEMDKSEINMFFGLAQIEQQHPDKPVPMEQLINLTYNLDVCGVAGSISNDMELGKLVAEDGLFIEIPEDMLKFVDFKKIGCFQRENDGGVYVEGCYVFKGGDIQQIYTGPALRPTPMLHTIEMDLLGRYGLSHLEMPCEEDSIKEIFSIHNAQSPWDISVFAYRSRAAISCYDIYDPDKILKVNELAGIISKMQHDELQKYNALLKALSPSGLPDIITLAQTLEQYQFYPEMTSPTDYARTFLSQKLGAEEAAALANNTNLERYGRDLMKRDNIIETEYGFICTTGLGMGSPLTAEKEEILPDQTFGGMKY